MAMAWVWLQEGGCKAAGAAPSVSRTRRLITKMATSLAASYKTGAILICTVWASPLEMLYTLAVGKQAWAFVKPYTTLSNLPGSGLPTDAVENEMVA
eukprot:2385357-Amphidinium_carterae.1